ncbi:MAG: hypothetical protein A3H60_01195 [Candidatus Zambryskibacteria bacterium RIFCSPLOWO2_02_FULL_44_12b]|uniref:Uncharacterized protein n=1 Tax=Candidatus Zambryskibacteria bacterium RIFCSPLOWO2_02_FULL_44_12b TaxID=1802772 RepID=A0A1G2UN62_9BACT|nr:MAG: hypothetical protein A3H60_01195 [Candidatus Zambryskibacteria bacterium RIFCSPLOWO2_02_FULL_44_12b]
MNYFRFFFGTPARLFVWLVLVGLAIVVVAPGLLAQAFNRLLSEVLVPLMTLGIIYIGFRVILKGVFGGGKKGRS